MTARQKKLGVTEYGIEMMNIYGVLSCTEAFLAKMATIKKGQYTSTQIIKKILPELDECILKFKCDDMRPLLNAISCMQPNVFHYTNTLGLDTITIR